MIAALPGKLNGTSWDSPYRISQMASSSVPAFLFKMSPPSQVVCR